MNNDILNERLVFQDEDVFDDAIGKTFTVAANERKGKNPSVSISDDLNISVYSEISYLKNAIRQIQTTILANKRTIKKLSKQYKSTNIHDGIPFDITGFEFTTDERIGLEPLNTIVQQNYAIAKDPYVGMSKYFENANNEKQALFAICAKILNYPESKISNIDDFKKLARAKFRNSDDSPKTIYVDNRYADKVANSINKLEMIERDIDKESTYIYRAISFLNTAIWNIEARVSKDGKIKIRHIDRVKFDSSTVLKESPSYQEKPVSKETKQFIREYNNYSAHLIRLMRRITELYTIVINEKYKALSEQYLLYCNILRKSMKSKRR